MRCVGRGGKDGCGALDGEQVKEVVGTATRKGAHLQEPPQGSWLLAPDPKPVRVIAVAAVPPKRSISRARWRHAQLVAEGVRAGPRLAWDANRAEETSRVADGTARGLCPWRRSRAR